MSVEHKPRILRGAFVEFGLSLPPLVVVFQFNPMQLTRSRELSFDFPHPAPPPLRRGRRDATTAAAGSAAGDGPGKALRNYHNREGNLLKLQKGQLVTVAEQKIDFEMRLDATAGLDRDDTISKEFGIAPALATLELMAYPKQEGVLAGALADMVGRKNGFSFTRGQNPPLVLFVFGRKRVLPVNINSLKITETDFTPDLSPIRATAAINLTVIEGKNGPYKYSQAMTEMMSLLNLAHIGDVANIVIPG